MKNSYLSKLVSELLEKGSKDQLLNCLLKVIDLIPDSKNNNLMTIINDIFKDEMENNNFNNLEKELASIEEQFDFIDTQEYQFHCITYATGNYNYYDEEYEIRFFDPECIGNIILNAYNLANMLFIKRDYQNAKKIFNLIIYTRYYTIDDDCGDIDCYDIGDIISYDLVNIDLNKICLSVLYITLLTSKNKCDEIYNYYEKYIFKDVKIEDSFNIGTDIIDNLDLFFKEWGRYLSKIDDDEAYNLLIRLLRFTNYDNYREILKLNINTHPNLYLVVFDYLLQQEKYEEITEIGNEVLGKFDDKINSEISLLLATVYRKIDFNYDVSDYLYKAFTFDSTVANLIRIINNNYLDNYKQDIRNIIKKLCISDEESCVLYYFIGEFDHYFDCFKGNKHYIDWTYYSMYSCILLMLFLLMSDKESNIKKSLTALICFAFEIDNRKYNLLTDDESDKDCFKILSIWKKSF